MDWCHNSRNNFQSRHFLIVKNANHKVPGLILDWDSLQIWLEGKLNQGSYKQLYLYLVYKLR